MFIDVHLVDALLQVTLISVFIGIFYFTYAKNVEKDVVIRTVHYLTNDLFKGITSYLPSMTLNIEAPDLSNADKAVNASNALLIQKAIKYLSILFISTLILTYIMSKYLKISYFDRLKHNLLILVFVGLTEFSFLNIVGRNFMVVDPNTIHLNVVKTLQSWSKS